MFFIFYIIKQRATCIKGPIWPSLEPVKMQVQFKLLVITDKVKEKKTSDFLKLYYHLSYITNDTY